MPTEVFSRTAIRVTGTLLALIPAAGLTHHPLAEVYDRDFSISLFGMIAAVQWSNPHAVILLDVPTPSGEFERWHLEMDPPGYLDRRGIDKSAFAIGTYVTVTGYASLDCSATTEARTLTLMDGKSFEVTTESSWNWRTLDPEPTDTTSRRADCD